jgi:hypothetical protein
LKCTHALMATHAYGAKSTSTTGKTRTRSRDACLHLRKTSSAPSRRNSDNAVQPLDDSDRPHPTVAGKESKVIATARLESATRAVCGSIRLPYSEPVPTVLSLVSGASKQTFPSLVAGDLNPPTTPTHSLISRWWNSK